MRTNLPIKHNRIQCLKCFDIIESEHRHDFKWCKCQTVAVDGGIDYLKRCGYQDDYLELTEWFTEEDLETDFG